VNDGVERNDRHGISFYIRPLHDPPLPIVESHSDVIDRAAFPRGR
jgi:hypothetical protein